MFAMVIGGEIVNRAIQPGPRLADGFELAVQTDEGLLDEVLRGFRLLDEFHRVCEQGRLEGGKEFRQRFRWESSGCGFFGHGHGHFQFSFGPGRRGRHSLFVGSPLPALLV